MRVLHRPTGKAALLYTSREGSGDRERATAIPQLENEPIINWEVMPVAGGAAGSPLPYVSCEVPYLLSMPNNPTPNEIAAQGGDMSMAEYVRQRTNGARLGFPHSHVYLLMYDPHKPFHIPDELRGIDPRRLVYRALQALPWTD